MNSLSKPRFGSTPFHVFDVALTPTMSWADRRRFFRRMRRQLRARGLLCSHKAWRVVVIPMGASSPKSDRKEWVSWLIEQPETVQITIYPTEEVLRHLAGGGEGDADIVAEVTRQTIASELLRMVAGALNQRRVLLQV